MQSSLQCGPSKTRLPIGSLNAIKTNMSKGMKFLIKDLKRWEEFSDSDKFCAAWSRPQLPTEGGVTVTVETV